uniref:Uncharacterized protein n=1 Tax=Babesia bovis TaxID=5865 RepID=S6CAS0_BABBO|nr:hypothetical protein [Babesia bovis]
MELSMFPYIYIGTIYRQYVRLRCVVILIAVSYLVSISSYTCASRHVCPSAACPADQHRMKCFIPAHWPHIDASSSKISHTFATSMEDGVDESASTPEMESALNDPELEDWKTDMADIPGAWRMFYPLSLMHTVGISAYPNIRPSVLFYNISGAVVGPEHKDSGKGGWVLDADTPVHIDDGTSYLHNRRFAVVLLSSKSFSNIKLVLLGRMFYSKEYVMKELKDVVQLRAVMFIGQAFVESWRSQELTETLQRIRRRITVLDRQGNEVDPLTWEFLPLNKPGSPFRWMHGNDKWKLLGPCTGYRVLGSVYNVPHQPMFLDKYNDEEIYDYVDPAKVNKTMYTAPELIEKETRAVIEAAFAKNKGTQFKLYNQDYMEEFYNEMVELAKNGPEYYKNVMQ